MKTRVWMCGLSLIGLLACSDDDPSDPKPPADGGSDAGQDASIDAGPSLLDASLDAGADAEVDAGPSLAQVVERGRYLVENIGACGDCHTPRGEGGAFDLAKKLSGVDCFADADPMNPNFGCLSSRNLTNHETGLKNRSDQEIKDMITKGLRPDGTALHPIMPYWVLANMTDADANAIVAFLRTVPGVDHMVAAPQAPFAGTPAPAPTWPEALIPQPSPSYPDQAAAKRGRYLAGNIGVCMECHTPYQGEAPIVTRAFEGGRSFASAQFDLPTPPFPTTIYTSNLTPHASGIAGYDVAKLVKAIKQGADKDDKAICPPMPSGGPMAAFAGITDADATDIAHYLLSLAAKENVLPNGCDVPMGPN